MKNILVCNQKGGVGKSLTADELAFSFERSGIPLAFLDLDSQGGTVHKTNRNPDAEVAVIDTPGALQPQLKHWVEGSDVIIIPTRTTSRDIEPLWRMRQVVEGSGKPVLYVINGFNRYRASRDFMYWFNGATGGEARVYTIPQSEMFVQSAAAKKSVVEYAKKSSAAEAILELCNAVRALLGFPAEA